MADIFQDEGRLDLAEPYYVEALEIYRGHEGTGALDLANAIRGYALLKESAGRIQEARLLWQEAGDLYASVNVEAGVEECRLHVLSGFKERPQM